MRSNSVTCEPCFCIWIVSSFLTGAVSSCVCARVRILAHPKSFWCSSRYTAEVKKCVYGVMAPSLECHSSVGLYALCHGDSWEMLYLFIEKATDAGSTC